MKAKITEAQKIAFNVLIDIGGWATAKQMQSHGGSFSAAKALIKHGLVEQRTYVSHRGFDCSEWRAIQTKAKNEI